MSLRAKHLSDSEAYVTFFKDLMLGVRTSIPAKIMKINSLNGGLVSVDVQVYINHTITGADGIQQTQKEIPILAGVPLVMPRSQTTGFSLTIPIAVGDDVLVVFSDRSIDNWQSTGKISPPAEKVTTRTHDLTDAVAIIGIFNDMTPIPNYSFDAIEMRNKQGDVSVSVSNDGIVLDNKGIKISIEGGNISLVNGASSITIESNKITIDSPLVEITGDSFEMGSSSNVTTGGGLTSSGGLDFENHIHSDPQGGNTGPPVNP